MAPEGTNFTGKHASSRGKAFWLPDPSGKYLCTAIPESTEMYKQYSRAMGGNEYLLQSPSELAPIDWMDTEQRKAFKEFKVGQDTFYMQPYPELHARLIMIDSRSDIAKKIKIIRNPDALLPPESAHEDGGKELVPAGPTKWINYPDAVKMLVANGVKKITRVRDDEWIDFRLPRQLLQIISDYFLDIGNIQQCAYTMEYQEKRGLEYDFNVEMEHVLKRVGQFQQFTTKRPVIIEGVRHHPTEEVKISMRTEDFAAAFGEGTLKEILAHRSDYEDRGAGGGRHSG